MNSEVQRSDEIGPERVWRQDKARWAVTARKDQVVQVQRVGVDRVDEGEEGRARNAMVIAAGELAGRAEKKAIAVTQEVSGPGAYGEAACRRKTTQHDKARLVMKLRCW